MDEKLKILVCDDDKAIVDSIEIYLIQDGYKVYKAYDGLQVLEILKKEQVHLVLLDIMMPNLNGLNTTRKIREEMNLPIILISAKSEDTDKIIGLNFGADDYITKPFNPLELLARVKSQLRRYTELGSMGIPATVIKTGGLELDTDLKEVRVDGEIVNLTSTELGILQLLMTHMGKIFSIEEIYSGVWQDFAHSPENTVAVHIRRIREKIEFDPRNPKYLKVVWGIGYKIEKYTL